jgi:nucleotide-binding universal stress UspA family protein
MNKRVFVAIDGSATAQLALVEAIHFASLPGASLCIGTVLDTSMLDQNNISMGSLIDPQAVKAELRQATDLLLDNAVALAKEAGLDAHRVLVESGSKRVAEMISDAANQWDADLIVIGTHGRRGFERLLMGSVAENLVRIATTSVFLVRRKVAPEA